ncbi:unnamed protein product, partial [Discosporangium mesarthrocarpum]
MRPSRQTGGLLAAPVALGLTTTLLRTWMVNAQTGTSGWLLRATTHQRYLGYDVPLDLLPLTSTHNSFTCDQDPRTHSNFEVVTAQIHSMTTQLSCLGVRGLELDPHLSE